MLLLSVAITFRAVALAFPFGDYDEGVYLATLRSLLSGYPLLTKTYIAQPPLLFYASLPFYLVSQTIASVRCLSLLSSLVVMGVTFHILHRKQGSASAWFAVAYLSINSLFVQDSRAFQADMLWSAFAVLALDFLLLFMETKRYSLLVLGAICFGLGVLTKLNFILLPVTCVIAVYVGRDAPRRLPQYLATFAGIVVGLFLVVIEPGRIMLLYYETVAVRLLAIHPAQSGFFIGARTVFLSHEWPLLVADILTIAGWVRGAFLKKGTWQEKISSFLISQRFEFLLMAWFLSSTFFFCMYQALWGHHLIFFILPCLYLSSPAIEMSARWARAEIANGYVLLLIAATTCLYSAIAHTPLTALITPRVDRHQEELLRAAQVLQRCTGPKEFVITDEQILLYLAGRNAPPNAVDTSSVRIRDRSFTERDLAQCLDRYPVGAVVFSSHRFDTLPKAKQIVLNRGYRLVLVGHVEIYRK